MIHRASRNSPSQCAIIESQGASDKGRGNETLETFRCFLKENHMSNINGINGGMPNRISMNVTVAKQTQGATFGEKVNAGLHAAGSAIGQGASLLGGALPGGSVISAAVSSVGSLAGGSGGGAASASYAATGVVGFSGGAGGAAVGGSPISMGAGSTGGPNLTAGAGTNGMGAYNNDIASMSAQNSQMLQVQMAMQRENTMFSSISNVLKTKHDTAKNSVGNIR